MRRLLLPSLAVAIGSLTASAAFANSPFYDQNGRYAGPLVHERAPLARPHAGAGPAAKLPDDAGYVATAPDGEAVEPTPPMFNHAAGVMSN